MKKNLANTSTFIAAVVGILVLVNILGLKAFFRLDVTKDKAYTLSQVTKDTLSGLEEPVAVVAYFTENLPAPYSGNARYVRDLLAEYRSQSRGKVSFEFVDPQLEGEKDGKRELKRDIFGRTFREPTQIEKELEATGVQPVEIRVVEEDQMQTKRAYMGLVIKHQEKREVIPLVQQVGSLEYDLTALIRKLTRAKTPVLGIVQGHGEPKPEEKLRNLQVQLSQNYEVRPIDLSAKEKVDDDVDALFVIGPQTPYQPNELKALDQFIMAGKSVGFFLDSVHVDPRTFESTPCDAGLASLLSSYGVTVGDALIADGLSYAQLNVQERRGFMVVSMPVPYPFIPLVQQLESESPISKGLGNVAFGFTTAVSAQPAPGRNVTVLARSTRKSWLEKKPYNLDPRRDWRDETVSPDGPHGILVEVSGKLPSHFAAEAAQSGAAPLLAESKGESRLVVAGGSSFMQDEFLQRTNLALVANIADWMLLDPALLAMRSRGLSAAPLKPELDSGTRNAAKFGNALGIPLLLVGFGLVRWRLREGRRTKATAAEA